MAPHGEGEVVSSLNARKLGSNAALPEDIISLWFNVIPNNNVDALEEPNENEPKREAALRLAKAEASHHRFLHKIETHYDEPNSV